MAGFFLEKPDAGEVLKVAILGPEFDLVDAGHRIDQGIGHGEFVAHTQNGRLVGDG
jgi:hypothetical protein